MKEVQGVGRGRADILFAMENHTTVAELKKTDTDRILEGLVRTYGLQTTSYQRSSVTFCSLMVLDLVDRGGSAAHVRERVAVVEATPAAGKTAYAIVTIRIQGRHDLSRTSLEG